MPFYEEKDKKSKYYISTFPSLFVLSITGEYGGDVMLENKFQSKLIKKIKEMFPDCVVLKNDPNYIQGVPDLTIFYEDKWATLECKRGANASVRPNQEYYVEKMNKMSFSRFISPENEKEVLHDLQQALQPNRSTRVSKRKQVSLDKL